MTGLLRYTPWPLSPWGLVFLVVFFLALFEIQRARRLYAEWRVRVESKKTAADRKNKRA